MVKRAAQQALPAHGAHAPPLNRALGGRENMKRISRDPQKFDLMRIIDDYARSHGVDIRDQVNQEGLLNELATQIETNRRNDILIHGLRIQSMFAYVAAALGVCRAIKEEDAGELYSAEPDIRAPDFRIITLEPRKLLVEVKNCHTLHQQRDYRFTRAYLDSLKRYASVFGTELFIAIYWSQIKLWTLLSASDFELRNEEYALTLPEAMKRNSMNILGDCKIGTIPSLTLKFLSDQTKPRAVDASGRADFTIGQVELYCGDQVIGDPLEKKIAWFLMNYGDWPGHQLPAEVVDGEVTSIGFRVQPETRSNPGERFELIGFLSQMVSRQFNNITAPDGPVKLLSPKREPDTFGVVIPPDYRGKTLPLWRFILRPSSSS